MPSLLKSCRDGEHAREHSGDEERPTRVSTRPATVHDVKWKMRRANSLRASYLLAPSHVLVPQAGRLWLDDERRAWWAHPVHQADEMRIVVWRYCGKWK